MILKHRQTMFEAIWQHGQVIPQEACKIRENARLLVIVVDEKKDKGPAQGWRTLKGKYRGKLHTVDQFIQLKQEEKRLEI